MKLARIDIELTGNVLSLTQGGESRGKRTVRMVQLQPETAIALARQLRLMEMVHG